MIPPTPAVPSTSDDSIHTAPQMPTPPAGQLTPSPVTVSTTTMTPSGAANQNDFLPPETCLPAQTSRAPQMQTPPAVQLTRTPVTVSTSTESHDIQTTDQSTLTPSGAANQKDVLPPGTCPTTQSSRAPLKVVLFSSKDNRSTAVSKAFETLRVPEIKSKKPSNRIREKLPKAISGSVALKMLKDRDERKKAEEEAKVKRKEEREQKRKEREQLKEKKLAEKAEKKKKTDAIKTAKSTGKGQKRKKQESESSGDSESENVKYMDSDDSASSFDDGCPGCGLTTGSKKDWVGCNKCPTWWHKWCTGEDDLVNMPYKQIVKYNFICMLCQ